MNAKIDASYDNEFFAPVDRLEDHLGETCYGEHVKTYVFARACQSRAPIVWVEKFENGIHVYYEPGGIVLSFDAGDDAPGWDFARERAHHVRALRF
jgi:hypothetical protein